MTILVVSPGPYLLPMNGGQGKGNCILINISHNGWNPEVSVVFFQAHQLVYNGGFLSLDSWKGRPSVQKDGSVKNMHVLCLFCPAFSGMDKRILFGAY